MEHVFQTHWIDLMECDPLIQKSAVVARVSISEKDEIQILGNPDVVEMIEQERLHFEKAVPEARAKDFLRLLTYKFRTPYLLASDVQFGEPSDVLQVIAH